MIQEQAMIANLNIRSWTARKHDRAVSNEVDATHNAQEGGRYNKLLIDKAALDPLAKHAGRIRDYHYKMTLPWGDNGDRLLPAMQYMEYTAAIRKYKDVGSQLTRTFVAQYPQLVADARHRLGTMYDANDYPHVDAIKDRFEVNVSFAPVPDAKDFRIDVGTEALAEITKGLNDAVAERQAGAVNECWLRLQEGVGKLHAAMCKVKPIFRDSILDNLADLVDMVPKLNITNDADLNDVCQRINSSLLADSCTRLRRSPLAREHLVDKTEDILAEISRHLCR